MPVEALEEVAVAMPPAISPMVPKPARVKKVTKESPDTFTLEIQPDEPAPPFQPGQFSMIYLYGVAELPISISGDPENTDTLTYTVRSVGQATHHLVTRKPGDWVALRGPFGTGWPVEEARDKDVILVAGGIGMAPLRPVLYHIFHHRKDYGRVVLLDGARSPRDLIYRQQLRTWKHQPDTQVLATVDYGGMEWHGHVGVVTTLFRLIRLDPERTLAMACGPEIMMRFVAMELESRGLRRESIYLSMERNMKCGVGLCGHCQHGPTFVCKEGPVYNYRNLHPWMNKYEI